jgi:hypothetical protein
MCRDFLALTAKIPRSRVLYTLAAAARLIGNVFSEAWR